MAFAECFVRLMVLIAAASVALAGCSNRQDQGQPAADAAAALRAAAQDPKVARFYEARGWRTAWTEESAAALDAAIGDAERHGLDPAGLRPRIEDNASSAQRDAARTQAALIYAEALARGRADPARLRTPYTIPRPDPDLIAGLGRALEADELGAWLSGLAPQDDDYRLLSGAYLQARRQIAGAQGAAPPALTANARTLAVNLERRRWLEREPPATRIDVNTGAATLTYWRDGRVADARRVVVGEPGNETPGLASPLHRLVANPTWTVPRSIEEEEIAPKGEAYMARNDMVRRDGRIVQEPGPRNSLGLVKFDMQNEHAIYLHDTPAKALFGQAERHASHGCVRVQDALGFARLIAGHEGVLEEWERALRKDDDDEEEYEEAFVELPRPIPVRLLYHTAWVENGRVVIAPDAYGWDDEVARALGLPAGPRRAAQRRPRDVGP